MARPSRAGSSWKAAAPAGSATRRRPAGFQSADYDKTELRGISDLTRLVGGAKVFNTLLGELVEKQPGKPALAPADDPRKDYSPAVSAEASFAEML